MRRHYYRRFGCTSTTHTHTFNRRLIASLPIASPFTTFESLNFLKSRRKMRENKMEFMIFAHLLHTVCQEDSTVAAAAVCFFLSLRLLIGFFLFRFLPFFATSSAPPHAKREPNKIHKFHGKITWMMALPPRPLSRFGTIFMSVCVCVCGALAIGGSSWTVPSHENLR